MTKIKKLPIYFDGKILIHEVTDDEFGAVAFIQNDSNKPLELSFRETTNASYILVPPNSSVKIYNSIEGLTQLNAIKNRDFVITPPVVYRTEDIRVSESLDPSILGVIENLSGCNVTLTVPYKGTHLKCEIESGSYATVNNTDEGIAVMSLLKEGSFDLQRAEPELSLADAVAMAAASVSPPRFPFNNIESKKKNNRGGDETPQLEFTYKPSKSNDTEMEL